MTLTTTSRIIASLLLAIAFTGVSSHAAAPLQLTAEQARHFLIRTGFAPRQAEVDALTGKPARQAVQETIRKAQAAAPLHPSPPFLSQPPPIPYRSLQSREEKLAQRQQQLREGLDIKAWWMREMLESTTPLHERMTLFWHSHFATSQLKVISSRAMWHQHVLMRNRALGSFRSLLHDVAKDPAMLVFLDGANSRKEAPNENFAREVMELFTLGEASGGARYTESDIREAARAFTGWSVEPGVFNFKLRPGFHDNGVKTVLGRSGNLDGDQVLDILLEQPAAATFIARKLWLEFVSTTPDSAVVERVARQLRSSDYDIGAALAELLLSDAFWAEGNRGSLVKSPVDLVVGSVRQFEVSYGDVTPFVLKIAQLGQNLLIPPNVKGWPGQNAWISATTLLERKRFTGQLLRVVDSNGGSKTPMAAPEPDGRSMSQPASPMPAMKKMQAEFAGGAAGQGGNPQAMRLMGPAGVQRVADAIAAVKFDPELWLARYGGHADQVPSEALKTRLSHVLLALPATRSIADGTVGVAYLQSLTLDPAYQLK